MGVYLHFGAEEGIDLASNHGWGDVVTWAFGLTNTPELHHLCQYGWCQNLPYLEKELAVCLKSRPPIQHDVLSTVENMARLVQARPQNVASCTISNGISQAEDEEGENPDEDFEGEGNRL